MILHSHMISRAETWSSDLLISKAISRNATYRSENERCFVDQPTRQFIVQFSLIDKASDERQLKAERKTYSERRSDLISAFDVKTDNWGEQIFRKERKSQENETRIAH